MGNVVEGLKATISKIGMMVWIQCVANKDRVIAREKVTQRFTDEEMAILTQALSMEITEVPLKLQFIVKTTEEEKTYEQRRMNIMTLSQLYAGFAQQTIPLAMQLFGPQGAQMKQQAPEMWAYIARLLTGSAKLMEDVFKFFGTDDTENYVPSGDKLDQMVDMMQGVLGAMQGMPQIGAPVPGAPQMQGMPGDMTGMAQEEPNAAQGY